MRPRTIVHIDLDAFFAAVEQRDNPDLKGKPVVVGADPKGGQGRGVVATCSYEARKYGIHSAMPISIAYKHCPHAVFLRGSFAKYRLASKAVFKILNNFTPHIEPVSIDEAFLDITESYHLFGTPKETGLKLKAQIKDEVGLTASVGIAPVKMIAKIASDYCKPDGLLEIKEDQVFQFLAPLEIGKLWGVGPKTKKQLNLMGIKTVGDIARMPLKELRKRFGQHGEHLYNLSNGIDPREVRYDDEVKSVSHEHTFNEDTKDLEQVDHVILSISEKLSRRLRKAGLKAKTITVKIRLKGFDTYTRAVTLGQRTNFTDKIYEQAKTILHNFYKPGNMIRLIGVRTSNFFDPYVQESLFDDPLDIKAEKVHKVIDKIKDKYGEESIHRAF